MFTVTPMPRKASHLKPIISDVTFGYFDQPIAFSVLAEGAPGPIQIEFSCVRDKGKSPYAVELTRSSDTLVRVSFFNPTEGGVSGLLAPVMMVASGGVALSFMFLVDVVGGGKASAYRITYEFGEAPIDPSLLEAKA